MAKTKEELEQLKNEINTLKDKLNELNEEELDSVIGAINDHTILPGGSEFWHSWNPYDYIVNTGNNLDLLNKDNKDDVALDNATFNGNISNREDK